MKKIFILFLMFSFLLYSFTKSEQSYIDKSKITKTSLPDDMVNTTGDTSYIITSIAIAYYDFNKKMIDYEEPNELVDNYKLYIKYAKKSDVNEYVPYAQFTEKGNTYNLIFMDHQAPIKNSYEKNFLLNNVRDFVSENSVSYYSGKSMNWRLSYQTDNEILVLATVGLYAEYDDIEYKGKKVSAIEYVYVFRKIIE